MNATLFSVITSLIYGCYLNGREYYTKIMFLNYEGLNVYRNQAQKHLKSNYSITFKCCSFKTGSSPVLKQPIKYCFDLYSMTSHLSSSTLDLNSWKDINLT